MHHTSMSRRRFLQTTSAAAVWLPTQAFSLQFGCRPGHSRCSVAAVPSTLAAVWLPFHAFSLQFGRRPGNFSLQFGRRPGITK